VLNAGTANERTITLNLSDGELSPDDLYILGWYKSQTAEGYGLLYDETGALRDGDKSNVAGEESDYALTMVFLEAGYNFGQAYTNYTGTNLP
jgi:hypothetical protein